MAKHKRIRILLDGTGKDDADFEILGTRSQLGTLLGFMCTAREHDVDAPTFVDDIIDQLEEQVGDGAFMW